MADFISKYSSLRSKAKETASSSNDVDTNATEKLDKLLTWEMFVDGSSTNKRARAGLLLISLEGVCMCEAFKFGFKATNNEAEYEALFTGLRLAKEMGAESIKILSDSQLIVNQIMGEYQAKEDNMIACLEKAKSELKWFQNFTIIQIPIDQNSITDALAKLA